LPYNTSYLKTKYQKKQGWQSRKTTVLGKTVCSAAEPEQFIRPAALAGVSFPQLELTVK